MTFTASTFFLHLSHVNFIVSIDSVQRSVQHIISTFLFLSIASGKKSFFFFSLNQKVWKFFLFLHNPPPPHKKQLICGYSEEVPLACASHHYPQQIFLLRSMKNIYTCIFWLKKKQKQEAHGSLT